MSEQTPGTPDRSARTVVFKGQSGERFSFQAWPLTTKFKAVGGVYIVTKRSFDDPTFTTKATHAPLVIGHTANLADALMNSSQLQKLTAQGANCICVCTVADAARRAEIEKDLIDGNEDYRGRLQSLQFLALRAVPPARPIDN